MKESKKDWMIDELEIHHFKSIRNLKLSPGRVNVFIGKPNTGKSNLLEALAFVGMDLTNLKTIPKEEIRYTDTVSLFYDHSPDYKNDWASKDSDYKKEDFYSQSIVSIKTGTGQRKVILEPDRNTNTFVLRLLYGDPIPFPTGIFPVNLFSFVSQEGQVSAKSTQPPSPPISNIKKYQFKHIPIEQTNGSIFALKPDGDNLGSVVKNNSSLKEFATSFYKEFSLEVLYDKKNQIRIIKRIGDSLYEIDFSMTPDTFQRMLYYLAAIESNKNAVILFEEPESQSYPPYIQMLAERIVDDTDNQYFITTHSPFIVEKMLEHAGNGDEGIKFFVTYFEDYQTKVHELSPDEINQIITNGIDLFL